MIKVKMLPASNGDCFLITINDNSEILNILVDGGISTTYSKHLKPLLIEMNNRGEKLNLVINTHIDNDHIGGLISLLKENNTNKIIDIDEIWFNGFDQVIKEMPKSIKGCLENDENKIDEIIKKGYSDDFSKDEKISCIQSFSFSLLIEQGSYKLNIDGKKEPIMCKNGKLNLTKNTTINIINPTSEKLSDLKDEFFEYLNSKTKVCIICPEHGEFLGELRGARPGRPDQRRVDARCGGSDWK